MLMIYVNKRSFCSLFLFAHVDAVWFKFKKIVGLSTSNNIFVMGVYNNILEFKYLRITDGVPWFLNNKWDFDLEAN